MGLHSHTYTPCAEFGEVLSCHSSLCACTQGLLAIMAYLKAAFARERAATDALQSAGTGSNAPFNSSHEVEDSVAFMEDTLRDLGAASEGGTLPPQAARVASSLWSLRHSSGLCSNLDFQEGQVRCMRSALVSQHGVWHDGMLCGVMLCCAALCHVVWHDAMLCDMMW